jgi:hypothetical protein
VVLGLFDELAGAIGTTGAGADQEIGVVAPACAPEREVFVEGGDDKPAVIGIEELDLIGEAGCGFADAASVVEVDRLPLGAVGEETVP